MTFSQLLLSGWEWDPSVIVGCAALMIGYLFVVRFRSPGKVLSFASGVLILLLALVSPLDALADEYLFSAHMVQHLLLVLVVPPLLLLGIPESTAREALKYRLVARWEQILGRPVIAWSLGVGTLWLWHVPSFYNAALDYEWIHIIEHLSFLITSVIFWWPVLAPASERRLSAPMVLVYLMPAGVANTLLGIVLAYSPGILYPAYLHPSDTLGILHLVRDEWGLSAKDDQTLGGLLMWFPGSFVYIGAIFTILLRWFIRAAADSPASSESEGRV
jgi:cytochrome c oxidase assembly factor CtaG